MRKMYWRLLPALLAAALCVLAPWALPVGPVPLTLATFGVYLAAGLLSWRQSAAAVGLYLLLGAVGMPVFSGFSGGLHRLLGVTGGFLLGYLVCALVAGGLLGRLSRPWMVPVALVAGTLGMYVLGLVWYMAQTGATLWGAFAVCVLPFLPGDGVKVLAATGVILPLRPRLEKWLRHPG